MDGLNRTSVGLKLEGAAPGRFRRPGASIEPALD